jgi:hypothetical protein
VNASGGNVTGWFIVPDGAVAEVGRTGAQAQYCHKGRWSLAGRANAGNRGAHGNEFSFGIEGVLTTLRAISE